MIRTKPLNLKTVLIASVSKDMFLKKILLQNIIGWDRKCKKLILMEK